MRVGVDGRTLHAGDDAPGGNGGTSDGCVKCTTPRHPPGTWGKCAVVGLAESILDHEFGKDF